jgi:hypothetical protein
LVNPADAVAVAPGVPSLAIGDLDEGGITMYVAVLHQFQDPPTAFARGEKLIMNEGAPAGARGLQFYPSTDGSVAMCLWESDSVGAIQEYVDSTLGDSSENTCYEVDAEHSFARQPLGISEHAAVNA